MNAHQLRARYQRVSEGFLQTTVLSGRGKGSNHARLIRAVDNHARTSAEPVPPVPASHVGGRALGHSPPGPGRTPRTHRRATTVTMDTVTADPPTVAKQSLPPSVHTMTVRRARIPPASPSRPRPGCSRRCPGTGTE